MRRWSTVLGSEAEVASRGISRALGVDSELLPPRDKKTADQSQHIFRVKRHRRAGVEPAPARGRAAHSRGPTRFRYSVTLQSPGRRSARMLYSLLVRRTCRSSTETSRVSRLTTSLPVLIAPRRPLTTEGIRCGDQRTVSLDGKSRSGATTSLLSPGLLAKTAKVLPPPSPEEP
jgi:hypothetical protein